MLSSISAAFKILTNLEKIQSVLAIVYSVVSKALDLVVYLKNQGYVTGAGQVLAKNIPSIEKTLTLVKQFIDKFGYVVNFSPVKVLGEGDPKLDLDIANAELEKLLK